MRLLPLLLLIAPLAAHAGEHYRVSEGPGAATAAFSRAAHQAPLRDADTSSVRVWIRDYMLGRVQGFVMSGNSTQWCRMASTYADGVVTLGPAKCRSIRHRAAALSAFNHLPSISRAEWDCPLMDGGEVYVERVQDGRVSVVRVGNPDACEDPESRAIAAALSKLS